MKILLTGGAGFIGSNLTEALLHDERVTQLRVLDNLATGSLKNLQPFIQHPKMEWIEGDIRDVNTCLQTSKGMDVICHQAALGSVPRSIQDPITSNEVNINGTLHIFQSAVVNQVPKVVYAASSSTYGDSEKLPKVEHTIGKPLSPYAVTKLVNELYADVFASVYGLKTIGLRYFNVFGPKQNPAGPYAAVIPLFAQAVLQNHPPFINGDGFQSRDFTYVSNAVQANIRAIFNENEFAWNQVYNIACGERYTVNELFDLLRHMSPNPHLQPIHREARQGDVRDSLADISKAQTLLGYQPLIKVKEGLQHTLNWYQQHQDYFLS